MPIPMPEEVKTEVKTEVKMEMKIETKIDYSATFDYNPDEAIKRLKVEHLQELPQAVELPAPLLPMPMIKPEPMSAQEEEEADAFYQRLLAGNDLCEAEVQRVIADIGEALTD